MSADLVDNPEIGGNSVYDDGSLSLMGHIFIGGAVTSESKPPTSDDVYIGAPDFLSDDIFFSNEFRKNLYADEFYDAVKTLHKTGTLATDSAAPTSGDEDKTGSNDSSSGPPESSELTHTPSDHPGNQDSDSSDSEDNPEPPDYADPGNFFQCGVYVWIRHDCTHFSGVYKPVD